MPHRPSGDAKFMITCENMKNIVRPKEQKRNRGRGRGSESGRILTDEHGLIDFAAHATWRNFNSCDRKMQSAQEASGQQADYTD